MTSKIKKAISQASHIAIITIFVSLLFPSILFADDKASQFGSSYNAVYRFIDNNKYLLAPLSGVAAGGVACGVWCAAAGGTLGAIDEASMYFGVTDKHYLTWATFGFAAGQKLKPMPKLNNELDFVDIIDSTWSVFSSIGGFAVGVLLPTGVFNEPVKAVAPLVTAPLVAAVAGKSRLGATGLAVGGVAGIV